MSQDSAGIPDYPDLRLWDRHLQNILTTTCLLTSKLARDLSKPRFLSDHAKGKSEKQIKTLFTYMFKIEGKKGFTTILVLHLQENGFQYQCMK